MKRLVGQRHNRTEAYFTIQLMQNGWRHFFRQPFCMVPLSAHCPLACNHYPAAGLYQAHKKAPLA